MSHVAMVVTTIGDGYFLKAYCDEAERSGVKDNLTIFVIPDLKTPSDCYVECIKLVTLGFDVRYIPVNEQDGYLDRYGIRHLIPYNSDNRRNVGYLMAYESGAEIIISIDDDNHCIPGSGFFQAHSFVNLGRTIAQSVRSTVSKWVNPCVELGTNMYPRGFPLFARTGNSNYEAHEKDVVQVKINAGLWDVDPDFDAVTWLNKADRRAVRFSGDSFVLREDCWAPVNTQNTALYRDVLPAYYFIPMGSTVNGMKIDRYGDIFSGYFAEACVKSMSHAIRFGTPVVNHIRNQHDHMYDLSQELVCMWMLEDILQWLPEQKLEGSSYKTKYMSLSMLLEDQVEKFQGRVWTVDAKAYWHRVAYCMGQWIGACTKIDGNVQTTRREHVENCTNKVC